METNPFILESLIYPLGKNRMTPKQILTILLIAGAGIAIVGWIMVWNIVAADPHGNASFGFTMGGFALVLLTFMEITELITVALGRPHCTLTKDAPQ